jgi:hypothetical protein
MSEYKCDKCGHVWIRKPSVCASHPELPPQRCPKCGIRSWSQEALIAWRPYHAAFDTLSNDTIFKWNNIRDKKIKENVLLVVKKALLNECDPFDQTKPLGRLGITKRVMSDIIKLCETERSRGKRST